LKTPAPHIPIKFLRWFCHPDLVEDVEGDVMELHEERAKTKSESKAKWWLWFEVLLLFRPGIIKPLDGVYRLNSYGMFKNHLTSAWRNLLTRKQFSALNILGLYIGMAACFVILQYVRFELSYDKFHPDVENLYRLRYNVESPTGKISFATNLAATGPALKGDFPEIERFTRVVEHSRIGGTPVISRKLDREVKSYYEDQILLTDPSFLEVFGFRLIAGDALTALNDPHSILITESFAKKYFGYQDPMNEILNINSDHPGRSIRTEPRGTPV